MKRWVPHTAVSSQLEREQRSTNELTKLLVVELRVACQLNTCPSAKPKSIDTKSDLIRGYVANPPNFGGFSLYYIFLRLFGVPMVERIIMLVCWPHPRALVESPN